jgi:acetyl esterase/lipase
MPRYLLFVLATLMFNVSTFGDDPEKPYRVNKDIEYAAVKEHRLLLDLYLPIIRKVDGAKSQGTQRPPLVVWVHGGAWRSGSKSKMPLTDLVENGFAIASVDYRLSPVAQFPAQIHDCKAAIRFLRGNAAKYGYDARRVGVAGSSAGGHLAALIGVTNNHLKLEGVAGDYQKNNSSIQAIVDYYGPTNFTTILQQSTPHGLSVRVPALDLLLGDGPEQKPELAKLASPVFHVTKDDPPLLLIHGDQDPQVPINQSHELHGVYKKLKLTSQFEVVHGGAHGGADFYDKRRNRLVREFFAKHLVAKQIKLPQ